MKVVMESDSKVRKPIGIVLFQRITCQFPGQMFEEPMCPRIRPDVEILGQEVVPSYQVGADI
jgi:hypothetical protein